MRISYDFLYHPGEEGLKSLSYTGSAEEVPNSNTEDQTHQICTVAFSVVLVGRGERKKEGRRERRQGGRTLWPGMSNNLPSPVQRGNHSLAP